MELSWKYVQMAVLLQRIGAVDIYSDINLLPCMRKTTFTRAQQFPPSCVFQWLEINCGLHSDSSHSAEGLLFIILKISVIWPYRKRSHFTLTQLLVSVSQIYSPPARRNWSFSFLKECLFGCYHWLLVIKMRSVFQTVQAQMWWSLLFSFFLSASFVLVSEVVVLTCLNNTSFHLHSPVRLASSFFIFVYLHTGSKIYFLNFICKYFVFYHVD